MQPANIWICCLKTKFLVRAESPGSGFAPHRSSTATSVSFHAGVLTKDQRDALITHQYRLVSTPGARILRFVQWQYKCLFGTSRCDVGRSFKCHLTRLLLHADPKLGGNYFQAVGIDVTERKVRVQHHQDY